MPIFFMHHRYSDDHILDEDGYDLPSLEDMRIEAFCAARELMAARTLEGFPTDPKSCFEITDEGGQLLLTVTFVETLDGSQLPVRPFIARGSSPRQREGVD